MHNILEIADKANIVVNGYAFTKEDNIIRVINLNHADSAAVLNKDGDILETSMDDIELDIVLDYFQRNRKYMED